MKPLILVFALPLLTGCVTPQPTIVYKRPTPQPEVKRPSAPEDFEAVEKPTSYSSPKARY